jgi:hypothetical protein
MTEDVKNALKSGDALVKLTEYAQDAYNRQMEAYMAYVVRDLPPAPPPSLSRRFSWWVQDRRWQFADWLRDVADRID